MNFSRAAPTYDLWAEAQRRMAQSLGSIFPAIAEEATMSRPAVLELGCGTGLLTKLLLERYAEFGIHGIDLAPGMVEHCRRRFSGRAGTTFEIADAEIYRPANFPLLVAANCTFQWFADPERTLNHMAAYLLRGGLLALGVMLPGSLCELAESYEAATGRTLPTLALWDEAKWRKELAAAGLTWRDASYAEEFRIEYNEPMDAIRALKEIGASGVEREKNRPLPPRVLKRLVEHYRLRYHEPGTGRVFATWRALYILAEK